MALGDWWERSVLEPSWLERLDREVEARGLGRHASRCFMAHSHLRRRTAKRLAALAFACALTRFGIGYGVFGLWFGLIFSMLRLPHETLRTAPPSRALDLIQAALFLLVPVGLLELAGGARPATTFAGTAESATLPLAAAAAALVLVDSWMFTRQIWYTCPDGLVVSNGRGRIRRSFAWSEIRTHRIESALRMTHPWFVESGSTGVRSVTDEWWLTLADGGTERLFLHQGSVLFAASDADPLSQALARGLERAHAQAARDALAAGETLSFGSRIGATELGCEIDGALVPWPLFARGTVGWGRLRRGGRAWTTPARPRWRGRVRSVLLIEARGGKLYVPTRQIEDYFTLRALRHNRNPSA